MLSRHLLGYLPVNLAQAIVAFGSIYLFTRVLPPADYGRYALVLAAAGLIHTIAFTWVEAAAHRFYAEADEKGSKADHFATLLRLWLAAAIPATVGVAGLLLLSPLAADMQAAAGFAAGSILFRSLLRVALESRRAARHVGRYSLIESLHVLGGFILGLSLILTTDMRSAGPFVGLLVAAATIVIFELPWLRAQVRGGRFSPQRSKVYLAYGAALSGAFALEQVLAVSDRFFIAHFLGEEALASYAAGYGLAVRGLDLLFVWASTAIAPLLVARYEGQGVDAARSMAKSSVRAMLAVSVPAAVGIAAVARPLAEVLVGPALATEAARIIPFVTAAGLAAGFITHYLAEAFLLTRRTGLRVLLLCPAVVVNIGLNATLIPHFGVNGAIASTLIAYWLAAVLLYLGARRLMGLPFPLDAAVRVLAAAGIMAGSVALLPAIGGLPELLLKSACGALVYVIAAVALNAAGVRDALVSWLPPRQAHAP